MIKEKNIGNKKKAGVRVALVTALVIGMMFSYVVYFQNLSIVPTDDGKGWKIVFDGNLAQAAEGNPGAGASGILEIFFINHSASNAYKLVNTSATLETWCDAANLGYANADDFNTELAHSVLFDIVIKVRVNKTHAWDGAQFMDSQVRMNLTSADLGIGADTAMEKYVYTNNSANDYIWLCFWYDFGNAGYDLSKDQSADITSIKLQAYY